MSVELKADYCPEVGDKLAVVTQDDKVELKLMLDEMDKRSRQFGNAYGDTTGMPWKTNTDATRDAQRKKETLERILKQL